MTEQIYRCNACRKVKGESNHWIAMRPQSRGTILPTLLMVAFEDCGPNDEHYCSPVCAGKRFNEFLDLLRKESTELAKKIAEDDLDAELSATGSAVFLSGGLPK